MSRIGKQPVTIPSGVTVEINGDLVKVSGSKGSLQYNLPELVTASVDNNEVVCTLNEKSETSSKHGLARTIISNMIKGCAEGFKKTLEVHGVGYRANVKGQELELSLGFSHIVKYPIPQGITIEVDGKTNAMTIQGADKHLVGQVAAEIRSFRKPEPYKGKGVKYDYERIRRKAGKSAAG
ncbi:MAG: 50S ribosomal protein L6 [Bdellovibrionales bacterium]|nr:50S ribosomal protein L6 [Bdellovibrionales bacterium]